jgi:hypothetical protein
MARVRNAHVGPFATAKDAERALSALAERQVKGVLEEVTEWVYAKPGCTQRKAWIIRIARDDAARARRIVNASVR